MTIDKSRSRAPVGANAEERRAWASFYARVGKDAMLAAEVIVQLDKDADLKRTHLALYMSSKETLRVHQLRQVRNGRIAHAVRWLFHLVFAVPIKLLIGGLYRSTEIAIASLPEDSATHEPAIRQVRQIARKKAFSADRAEFERQSKQPTG